MAVARVWRAAARPDDVPKYLHVFHAQVAPELQALPGFLGASVLTAPRGPLVDIVVTTRWTSRAAIEAFAGADLERAVIEPEALAVLAEHDDRVRHFDVALEI
jgi:heme-degrading monooxygenase HmoA